MKISYTPPFALLFVTLAGCHGNGTTSLVPDFVATPTALSLNACPTKDETSQPVSEVYPDVQKVTVQNRSKAQGSLSVTLSGADAKYFTIGTVPSSLAGLASVDVPVSFSPDHKGDMRAQLSIDDGTAGTDNPTVTLIGTGLNLPSQPSIQTAPQKTDRSGYWLCDDAATLDQCTVTYPETLYGQSSTLEVKIRNTGCPTLKITSLSIASFRGDNQGFTIESPAQLPSESSPILLNAADGTQEITVVIRFTPTEDSSGNTDRSAYLSILSNDKMYGDGSAQPARIGLTGQGVKPSIYASPTYCDFSNLTDPCGFTTAQTPHDTARFRVLNDGSTTVQISKVAFTSSGTATSTGARFTAAQSLVGQSLTPGQSATLEVKHADQSLYVSDTLTVDATIGGVPAGSATMLVYGGTKPCLTTDPMNELTFMDPSSELTTQNLRVLNGAGCGVLTITNLSIDPSPFFSVVAQPASNQIAAGESATVTVQYKRPTSGGMQLGTLRIESNDSSYAPAKLVQLYSKSPLDQVPVAALTACKPTDLNGDPQCKQGYTAAFSASLATLSPAQITLSGSKSTDDNGVAQYRFTLLPPFPPGVTSAALANHATMIATPTTTLAIAAGATGVYRVSLEVWDNRGQKSANPTLINLNITP